VLCRHCISLLCVIDLTLSNHILVSTVIDVPNKCRSSHDVHGSYAAILEPKTVLFTIYMYIVLTRRYMLRIIKPYHIVQEYLIRLGYKE